MKKIFPAIALAAVASMGASVLSSGASAATLDAVPVWSVSVPDSVGVRYRGKSTGGEHYVGVNDLGVGGNRNESGFNWVSGTTYGFNFSYDSADGSISSTIGGNTVNYGGTSGLQSDLLLLSLFNQSKQSATFDISNMVVNGDSVGGLSCANGSRCQWTLSDFTTGPVLNVSGDLTVAGIFDNNDSERVRFEITANTTAPSAVPLPAAAWLLLAGIGGLGAVARRKRSA